MIVESIYHMQKLVTINSLIGYDGNTFSLKVLFFFFTLYNFIQFVIYIESCLLPAKDVNCT